MLKRTISYVDFDGNHRTEDFYFNLSRAEVTEMELSYDGGFTRMLEKIIQAQDGKRIIKTFKDFILRSYGEKSDDGRRFVKNQALRDAFAQTEAYTKLFMELSTDAEAAAAFVNAIIPQSEEGRKDGASRPPVAKPASAH